MELTAAQILQVENYLAKNKFEFIDLKVEVLDHMISDIESFTNENHSFENAFKMTVLKWNKHFRETSSFYFGIQYSESKIVVKKAKKMFKPFFFLYITAYILPVFVFMNFQVVFSKTKQEFLNQAFSFITLISLIYVLYIIINVLKSKIKTTYSFILKTQYMGAIFLVISLIKGDFFNNEGDIKGVFTGFLFAGFAVTYICHVFYKKHKKAIKKYKIS
jgi:ABC-type antimicrobial peptide transport system permease subunit